MESSSSARIGKNESAIELETKRARSGRPAEQYRPSRDLVLQFSSILDKIADQLLEVQAELSAGVTPRPVETKQPARSDDGREEAEAARADEAEPASREDGSEDAGKSSVEARPGETEKAASVDPLLAGQAGAAAIKGEKEQALPDESGSKPLAGRLLETKQEAVNAEAEGADAGLQGQAEADPSVNESTTPAVPKLDQASEKAAKLSAKSAERAAEASAGAEETQAFEEAIQKRFEGSGESQEAKGLAEQQRSVVKESVESRSLFMPTEKLLNQRSASIAEKLDQAARLVGAQEKDNGISPVLRQAMESAGPKASGIVKAGPSALQAQNAELSSALKQNQTAQKEQAESSKALPRALQLRTLEKVESVLTEIARSKDGKSISVRLDPPSLGSVKVDISLRDGSLHARIVAESPQVNMLLREKAYELQNLLRRVGLDMERVSVSVGNHEQGAAGGQSGSSSFDFQSRGDFPDPSGGSDLGLETAALQAQERVEIVDDHWVA